MPDRTQLRLLLDAYLDGEIPLYELRGRFYSGHISLNDEVVVSIHRGVSLHPAMYTAGTWPEDELKRAICWHIASAKGEDTQSPLPMIDGQWMEIMLSVQYPWPIEVEGLETPI